MNPGLPKNVREALNRQTVPGPHPVADLLNAYAERALQAQEDAQIAGHLAACPECREVVFLASSAVELMPEAAQIQPERTPVTWWRWAMPATALLLLTVAFVAKKRNANEEAPRSFAVQIKPAEVHDEFAIGKEEQKLRAAPKTASLATPPVILAKEKRENGAAGKDLKKASPEKALIAQTTRQPLLDGASVPARAAQGDRTSSIPMAGAVVFPNTQNTNVAIGGPSQRLNQQNKQQVAVNNVNADAISTAALSRPAPPPPPPSAAQTVDVEAAAAPVMAEKAGPGGMYAFKSMNTEPQVHRSAMSRIAAQLWRITPDGHIERMMQNQWHRALNGVQMAFHAVSTVQDHVWAGGIGPKLFHSSDGGENWNTVEVKSANSSLNGTVQSIRANDATHVSVITDAGETWTTADGGQTWEKQ